MTMRAGLVALVLASAVVLGARPAADQSAFDPVAFDASIRPQDDLFRFVNGRWLATVEIPRDRVLHGTFVDMLERTENALKAIVEDVARTPHRRGSRQQQIADLYTSFMDEARIEALGTAPIQSELKRIAAIRTPADFAAEAGFLGAIYQNGPFGTTIATDGNDTERLIIQVSQGGTRLPSRDYYLKLDPVFVSAREKYEAYLTTIFTLIGRTDAPAAARQVLLLETAIARGQLTPVESREALKTVRRTTLAELAETLPGFDWKAWAKPQGIDRAANLVLLQPSFFKQFSVLVPAVSIDSWKAWLTARFVFQATPYLGKAFVDARFDLFGRLLAGQPELTERWRGGVGMVNAYLGDALGQLYVERHFSSRAKARAEQLVSSVIKAYRQTIAESTWLSRETRNQATDKLARIAPRVGFPDRWRDYSGLIVKGDDLVGNWMRATAFVNSDRMSRIRSASDAAGWIVNPQTMNAYYNPATNEILVTAAMLQSPLFDVEGAGADDASNYGALGATIGHEISHALDERGRRFDARGELRRWWTDEDEREYDRRGRGLVGAFSAFTPIQGLSVNGAQTLEENVADLAGLTVAYRAYMQAQNGHPPPVIGGFTGEQRFFLAYARMWRMKVRDDYLRQWLLTFPHAPEQYRTNGIVSHVPAFYSAFGLKAEDALFRPPESRVRIW